MKSFEVKLQDGTVKKVTIRKPSAKDIDQADTIRAAKVAEIIKSKEKILSRYEIDGYLRSNGIWTVEDEQKVVDINKEIHALLEKLRKGGLKISEGREIAVSITKKRIEAIRVSSKRRVFDDSTIESQAEHERNDYLAFACTVDNETGEQLWDTWEDFKEDRSSDAYYTCAQNLISVLNDDADEFEKKLPENRWLRKYGFIDDELRYTDRKTGKFVDEDGNPIEKNNKEIIDQIQDLQGEINEESPFVDDETGDKIEEVVKST